MSSKPLSIVHIRRQDLQFLRQIGEGGYSTVFHAIWKSDNGDVHVAVKKPHTIDEHELEVLSKLDHPNVVKLIGVNPDKFDFMLIIELCELGSLRSYIDKHGKLPPDLFDKWSKQAARAIKYLQDQNIVHKDIKSQNYVISSDMVLKLVDFGLAKELDITLTNATERGTIGYMAPELLKDGKLSPTKYDIFALGVVIWEMLTGKIPYEGMEYVAVVWYVCKENKRLEIPVDCPGFLDSLINQCWLEDYKHRPDIEDVIFVLETKKCKTRNQWPWKFHSQFGHEAGVQRIHQPFFIVAHKDGNVVVYDYNIRQMKMYDNKGVFKRTFGRIATRGLVATESDGNYVVAHSKSIEVYKATGDFKTSIIVLPPESTAELRGMALDTNGDILVGVKDVRREGIESVASYYLLVLSKHLIQGDEIEQMERESKEGSRKIPVGIDVGVMTVTRLGTIVIFGMPWTKSWQPMTRKEWPQIIDKAGEVLHTLNPPPEVTDWRPCGACCNADTIYVTNDHNLAPKEYGVYCYSLSGDYLGCATKEVTNPTGIAMTQDGNMMFVAQYELGNPEQGQGKHGVKVFHRL